MYMPKKLIQYIGVKIEETLRNIVNQRAMRRYIPKNQPESPKMSINGV